jgi:hypothetical protein
MKWLTGIIIIIIIIVVLAGWYIWSSSNTSMPPQTTTTSTTTAPADIIAGTPNQTYTNSHLSFSIEYPATASATSDFSSGFLPLTQTPVIAFELPRSMFSGTNLAEAGVYIGATTTPSVMSTCTQQVQGETATTSQTVGGQNFSVFTSTDAAAGNRYQEKTFRAFQNGSCLEIVELLHYGVIENYPPGTVQQFDEAKFSGILDSIVQTYYPIPTGQ